MFKRVEKRIKKAEQEEELGLDEEMKAALGLNNVDTDSDESDSDSASGSGSEADSGDDDGGNTRKRKRAEDDDGEDQDSEDEEGEEEEDESADEEDGDDVPPNTVPFSMTIADALSNPTYIQVVDPEIQACIVCPGKLLKNQKMTDVHLASGGHKRRFRRFVEAASKDGIDKNGDPRTIVSSKPLPPPIPAKSQRAEKRRARLAAIEEKRRRQRDARRKAKAQKEQKRKAETATASEDPSEAPKTPAVTASFQDGVDFIPLGDDSPSKPKPTKKAGPRQERKQKQAKAKASGEKEKENGKDENPGKVSKKKKQKMIHERGVAKRAAEGQEGEPPRKKAKVDAAKGRGASEGGKDKRQRGKRKTSETV
ncbi:hypothetical protein OE88DRAFT_1661429 [Heliocybe sulcata]|uniref:Uncharacterized protein n=1 Tax=Heliocybe sulcata TaxID=5364 RepID=A0A5C3N0H4_9AGAM|nr:hypothetical protein OE88DRAFT_1661429 [Heliocybe sulcata]